MTTPITNQAALEQGQRVARDSVRPIRQLPAQSPRVESGPVQFDGDWPGVFIRGDNAGWFALQLKFLLAGHTHGHIKAVVEKLRKLLAGCIVGPAADVHSWPLPPATDTFPPEIPPHIQYLRQLPAAKAGQAIEEAAADEIRRLREEKNYHFDQVQRACVNMNNEALKVAALTAERDALAEREQVWSNAWAENARLSEQAKERLGFLDEISEHVKQILSHHPPLEMLPVVVRKMAESHKRLTAERAALAERESLNDLAAEVIEVCKLRNWSLHWTARGAYLHLEASELIEAIRGKRGVPQAEAADVLIVLMSITQNAGIPFDSVVTATKATLAQLRMKPPYKGEERTDVPDPSWLAKPVTVRPSDDKPEEPCGCCGELGGQHHPGCHWNVGFDEGWAKAMKRRTAELATARAEAEAAKGALENSRKLISNWRAGANCLSDADGDGVYREMYHRCASELEAALAATDSERPAT